MEMCFVMGCKHVNSHITCGHRCKLCKKYGRGLYECGDIELIKNLSHSVAGDTYSASKWCTVLKCKDCTNHSTEAHHCVECGNCHFNQDSFQYDQYDHQNQCLYMQKMNILSFIPSVGNEIKIQNIGCQQLIDELKFYDVNIEDEKINIVFIEEFLSGFEIISLGKVSNFTNENGFLYNSTIFH